MKTKALVTLCILFILGACPSPEEPVFQKKITLHIQGIVTDETNGSPVSDASIYLYESSLLGFESYLRVSVKTNQEGRYTLNYFIGYSENVLFGYYIEAQKDGYLNSKWVQVQYTSNTQIIDFQLEPLVT